MESVTTTLLELYAKAAALPMPPAVWMIDPRKLPELELPLEKGFDVADYLASHRDFRLDHAALVSAAGEISVDDLPVEPKPERKKSYRHTAGGRWRFYRNGEAR